MELHKIVEYLETILPAGEIIEREDYYVMPTICHNEDHSHASKKLYLYKNEDSVPLFTCYTECSDTFNIYTLIQKYHDLKGTSVSYKEAYKEFHGVNYVPSGKQGERKQESELKYNSKFVNPLEVELPSYSPHILDLFYTTHMDPWALEGIDLEVLKQYGVSYSKSYEGVMIPHLDRDGRLIGLRVRTSNIQKAKFAKYMPAHIGNILYRHPLSMNLYGLYENQENIKKMKSVMLTESEKSVLQWESMSEDKNNVLAVCGQSISKWQMDMLIYFLGVEEVVIAFDKEYSSYTEAFAYVERIKGQLGFLLNFANVYVLIDEDDVFRAKESPFDRTVSDFYKLKRWKIND